MIWPDLLTVKAFESWLVRVAGGERISQGQRLDPFATSMRKFTPVAPWLELVSRGEQLPHRGGGGGQATVDLRSAGLVTTDGADVALSELGRECLAGWRDAGVANTEDAGELVRSTVAIIAGVRLGVPTYLEMLSFWKQLRARYTPGDLFASPAWLYLVSYLNREVGGYNPWRAIAAQPPAPLVDFESEWEGLVDGIRDAGALAAAEGLKERVVDFATRPFGRVVFCMAMESYVLGEIGAFAELSEQLESWRLPRG